MKFNRDFWEESFKENEIPHWVCPVCNSSVLTLDESSVQKKETNQSIKDREESYWQPWYIEKIFLLTLVCVNKKCEEKIFIVGNCKVHDQLSKAEKKKERVDNYPDFFYP